MYRTTADKSDVLIRHSRWLYGAITNASLVVKQNEN